MTADVKIDGLSASVIANKQTTGTGRTVRRMWASAARPIDSRVQEVLDIKMASPRLVNTLLFEISRYPLDLSVVYLDPDDGTWKSLHYRRPKGEKTPTPTPLLTPVGLTIANSVPSTIVTERSKNKRDQHPQHFGENHWRKEAWSLDPVRTAQVRFIIQRNPDGRPPHDKRGKDLPYSIAMRKISLGFRITHPDDVTGSVIPGEVFESSNDPLGSSVNWSLVTRDPQAAIDTDKETIWASSLMPVSYAVVPYYLDMRDADGEGQVVDSFYLDPITPGVSCNLYYSNSDPIGDFVGSTAPVPVVMRREMHSPEAAEGHIRISPAVQSGIEISSTFTRVSVNENWWVGIDAVAFIDTTDDGVSHPIFSLGGLALYQEGPVLRLACEQVETTMDLPEHHVEGSRFRLVIEHVARGVETNALTRLTYQQDGGGDVFVAELGHDQDIPTGGFRVGLDAAPEDMDETHVAAIGVVGLVLKQEPIEDWVRDIFLTDGESVVIDDLLGTHRNLSTNAAVRMHPVWVTTDNLFGVVGGESSRMGSLSWVPVNRNYILQRGRMTFPPTKARYWKFEFTNLSARPFAAPFETEQDCLFFPPDVVKVTEAAGPQHSRDFAPHGIESLINGQMPQTYNGALAILSTFSDADPTTASALVIDNPVLAQQVADQGWIWQYEPWHMGTKSPMWTEEAVHQYEEITLRHRSAVGYWVGLREIVPSRLLFGEVDDTEEYMERFLDDANISLADSSTTIAFGEAGVAAESADAVVTSTTYRSLTPMSAVQFLTQQSNPEQVLDDPDFREEDIGVFYQAYGDAALDRLDTNLVVVDRSGGNNLSYGGLEAFTYGDLEVYAYGQLGGGTLGESSDGGLVSYPYGLTGIGELVGRARVSADVEQEGPVLVEIVDSDTNEILASVSETVPVGSEVDIQVSCEPLSLSFRTYGDVEALPDGASEATYGDLEGYTYGELSQAGNTTTSVVLRVRQTSPPGSRFHVHRMALYDDPIQWEFSVDDGASWWMAPGVRNDPNGVLTFPEPGNDLRWRCTFRKEGAHISALHIRPWYRHPAMGFAHDLEIAGPTHSAWDAYPTLTKHPMAKEIHYADPDYIETLRPVVNWRNLVLDPSQVTEVVGADQWQVTGLAVASGVHSDTALYGSSIATLTVDGTTDPVMASLLGPGAEEDQMWHEIHRGVFAIPNTRQRYRKATVSGRFYFRVQPDGPALRVQPAIQWLRLAEDGSLIPGSLDPFGPTQSLAEDPEFTEVSISSDAPNDFTHWRPVFTFTKTDGSRPDAGIIIETDGSYVTECGLTLSGRPYLDGDQSYGLWEGEAHASTSVFGTLSISSIVTPTVIVLGSSTP